MFTGIVEAVGTLQRIERRGPSAVVEVRCPFTGYTLGESIAVDGVCLTVTRFGHGYFCADVSVETLQRSTLGDKPPGARLNLERAVPLGGRMGGHIVGGHVDGVGHIVRREAAGEAERVTVSAPPEVLRFVAEKGSIAVDGVSLTVNRVSAHDFEVMLVPYTRGDTTLADKPAGTAVNLEVDVLARYVARLMEPKATTPSPTSSSDDALQALLQRQGYL